MISLTTSWVIFKKNIFLGKRQGYYSSESEAEDLPNSKVQLGQDYQGKKKSKI